MADTEDLVLSISADTRQMKRALDRLISETDGAVKTVRKQFDSLGQSMETDIQKRINGMVGAVKGGAKEWKGALADQGEALDSMRAKFNPVFQVITRYKATISEIKTAHRLGAISADEMAAAISRERQASLASIAAIKARNSTIVASVSPIQKFGKSMQSSALQTGNLAAQLNDIGVQLAGGQSPFLIALQQGSQINQVLGQGGARAAVAALGGAFTSLVNPVSLATIAIISLGGAAIQYFTEFLGNSKESEKTLKEQADLIDKVAKKWGVATPALKAYVDQLEKAQDAGDLKEATKLIQIEAFKDFRETIEKYRVSLSDLQTVLGDEKFAPLQAAFVNLDEKVADGTATFEDLKKLQTELQQAFVATSIPAANQFAKAIENISKWFNTMADSASNAGQELRNALKRDEQSFFDPRDPRFNNGVLPQSVPAPNLLGVDDVGNNPAFRGFQENLEDASGAIEGFVNRVVQAESGGRADAKNPSSSATGVGQFIESTWLGLFRKYYPEQAATMGQAAILELRKDSDVSRNLIEKYAQENARILQAAGVHVDEAALQLSHFLGAGDAAKVLSAAPGTPLSGLISQSSINANPTILGGGKTVDDARAYAERRAGAASYAKANEEVATSLKNVDTASKGAQASTEQLQGSYVDLGEIGTTALRGLANALSDGKIEGQELLQIAVQIVEQLLTMQGAGKGLGGLFSGGGGGLLGGAIIPGILHSGGIAGSDGYSHGRKVPLGVFAGAPRYHGGGIAGLRPNEIPAILQRGERVIPNGARGGAGGGQITLHVKGEEGPMFRPTIQAESQGVAVKVVQAGITKYDKRLDKTLGGKMANAQARTL